MAGFLWSGKKVASQNNVKAKEHFIYMISAKDGVVQAILAPFSEINLI